jgi:hypothetical protein
VVRSPLHTVTVTWFSFCLSTPYTPSPAASPHIHPLVKHKHWSHPSPAHPPAAPPATLQRRPRCREVCRCKCC